MHSVIVNLLNSRKLMIMIRGTMNNWFSLYLVDRLSVAEANSKQSAINRIFYGVSQCSLLGPYYSRSIAMMFLILHRIEVITLFTDMYAHNNLKCVEVTSNSELGQVSDRLNANALTSNIKKTNFHTFNHINVR